MFVPLLLAAALAPPPAVPRAIEAALGRDGARAVVRDYRPSLPDGCRVTGAAVKGALEGSGAVTVTLEGRDATGARCEGWALVRARLHAKVLVATRTLAAGDALEGAVAAEERELPAGVAPLDAVAPGAVAAWPIPAGAILTAARVRAAGPRPGASVPVVVSRGGFTVETAGTLVACSGGRSCALLPSGKRLEGTVRDGKFHVEAP